MSEAGIFLSHTTADDAIVEEIRGSLEGQGLSVWVDSRELSGGDDLSKKILDRIERAAHFMVVLSSPVMNSKWVGKEIKHALKVQEGRDDGYKVIPILLKGVRRTALHHWFGKKEPLSVRVGNAHDAVANALVRLLSAACRPRPRASDDEGTVYGCSQTLRGTGYSSIQRPCQECFDVEYLSMAKSRIPRSMVDEPTPGQATSVWRAPVLEAVLGEVIRGNQCSINEDFESHSALQQTGPGQLVVHLRLYVKAIEATEHRLGVGLQDLAP